MPKSKHGSKKRHGSKKDSKNRDRDHDHDHDHDHDRDHHNHHHRPCPPLVCDPAVSVCPPVPSNPGDSVMVTHLPTNPYAQLVGFPPALILGAVTLLSAPFAPILAGTFAEVPFAVANPVSPYSQILVVPDSTGNPAAFELEVTNAVFRVSWLVPVTDVLGTLALYQQLPVGVGLGAPTEVAYSATSAIVLVGGLGYFQNSILYRNPIKGTQISLRNAAVAGLVLPILSTLGLAPVPNFNVEMISLF